MKKIITLCSLILTLAIVVTAFTACGDNKDNDTTTGNDSSVSVDAGFVAEIGESEAVIKSGSEVYQTLKYPINSGMKFDKTYAEKNNAFLDMNFDGEPDFYIAISSDNGVINYFCWLYNATTKKFDYSVILSALKNISIDSDYHRVLSNLTVDGEQHILSYKWVDGQLLLDTDYNDAESEIPEDITKVVEDNAIGLEKPTTSTPDSVDTTKENNATSDVSVDNNSGNSPETTTKKPATDSQGSTSTTKKPTSDSTGNVATTAPKKPSTTSSDDKTTVATTKPKKPANTTTTAPNVSHGIVIETGNLNAGGWY